MGSDTSKLSPWMRVLHRASDFLTVAGVIAIAFGAVSLIGEAVYPNAAIFHNSDSVLVYGITIAIGAATGGIASTKL